MSSQSKVFTVVSLFSGCGGSSLGYRLAGGKVLLAVENDAKAVAVYQANFPQTKVWQGDICELPADTCMKAAKVSPGELDILDGSPPCQGFSTSGKREFADTRNQLYHEFIRLLAALQPKAFVMENVSGMVKGKMRLLFVDCLRRMKASGYRVAARVLNAMYYGVPQSRERLIFIGIQEGLGVDPSHPTPQSRPKTVRQTIGHLPIGKPGDHSPRVIEAWHKSNPGQSLRKAVSYVGSFQSCRLDPDRPSQTQIRAHRHWHYATPRQLSDLELALLSSFPASFKWPGAKGDMTQWVGNAVPPNFMRAIAEHVQDTILGATR